MKAFPYEVSEQPPAPYVDVEIKPSFLTVSPLRYRAKVDSGAAMTVIPGSLIDQWKLKPFGVVVVRGYNGQASMRPTYLLLTWKLEIKNSLSSR